MPKGSFGKSFGKSSGGVGGTGVHAVAGSTTICSATDKSAYCTFVKIVNVVGMIIFVFLVGIAIYNFFSTKTW